MKTIFTLKISSNHSPRISIYVQTLAQETESCPFIYSSNNPQKSPLLKILSSTGADPRRIWVFICKGHLFWGCIQTQYLSVFLVRSDNSSLPPLQTAAYTLLYQIKTTEKGQFLLSFRYLSFCNATPND
jgi:hypothetical protein